MEERFPQEVCADPMSTVFLLRSAAGDLLSLGQKESRYLSVSGYGYLDRARPSLLDVLRREAGDVRLQSRPSGAHRDSNRPATQFSWQDLQGGAYSAPWLCLGNGSGSRECLFSHQLQPDKNRVSL